MLIALHMQLMVAEAGCVLSVRLRRWHLISVPVSTDRPSSRQLANCKQCSACIVPWVLPTRDDCMPVMQEIKMQEGDCSFLAGELKALLDADSTGRKKQPNDAPKLEYLTGLIKDLFLDWQRFSGVTSSKSRLSQLTSMLQDGETSSDEIVQFILHVQ